MNEIEKKIEELWKFIEWVGIPQECKGRGIEAHKNRVRWQNIRANISELIDK